MLVLGAAPSGCGRSAAPASFQGVVELDERAAAFESGGRLQAVRVRRGDRVEPGAELASLDDALPRRVRDARAAEVRAAEAQVALLLAGSRSEEVRAAAAQLRAAQEAEQVATRAATRERGLQASSASTAARLDEAERMLVHARSEREALEERLRALRAGARSQEIAAAQARLDAARAALAAEEERLARAVLRAPVGGRVLDVHFESGEVVGAGVPIVTIGDTRRPYVDVFVAQGRLAGLAVGTPATVRVDAERDRFRGQVEDVGRRTEFTPRYLFSERERPNLVVRVRVRVADPAQRLHAGIPAFVTFAPGGR